MTISPETQTCGALTHRLDRLLANDDGSRWNATCSCGHGESRLTAEAAARAWSEHLVDAICAESILAAHRRELLEQEVIAHDLHTGRRQTAEVARARALAHPRPRGDHGRWRRRGEAA